MFRVSVFDQEIVNSFWDFCGPVEPADYHHESVSLALLELCYVADIVRLVRTLTFYEDVVANFVFYGVVVTAISQELSLLISPRLPVGMFLSPDNRLFDVFFVHVTRYRAAVLKTN